MKKNKTKLTLLRKSSTKITSRPDSSTLEAFRNKYPGRNYWVTFDCPEFTSLCPITGQPDFGHVIIQYLPGKLCLESKSLKLYLFSFRNNGSFHEEVINRIMDDICKAIQPRKIIISGNFNRRGGIAISVKSEWPETDRNPQ